MPLYDATLFDPPAPVARVMLRDPHSQQQINNVPMLLDTGADISLVPLPYVLQIGIQTDPHVQYELMGFDGNRSVANMVFIEIGWESRTFKGQFLVVDQEWGIIGRNILNLLSIVFDGTKQIWEIQRRYS